MEMLLAHIVTQTVVMLIQCMEIIFLAGIVFGTTNNGNDFTVIFLLMLLGFAGMCFGKTLFFYPKCFYVVKVK